MTTPSFSFFNRTSCSFSLFSQTPFFNTDSLASHSSPDEGERKMAADRSAGTSTSLRKITRESTPATQRTDKAFWKEILHPQESDEIFWQFLQNLCCGLLSPQDFQFILPSALHGFITAYPIEKLGEKSSTNDFQHFSRLSERLKSKLFESPYKNHSQKIDQPPLWRIANFLLLISYLPDSQQQKMYMRFTAVELSKHYPTDSCRIISDYLLDPKTELKGFLTWIHGALFCQWLAGEGKQISAPATFSKSRFSFVSEPCASEECESDMVYLKNDGQTISLFSSSLIPLACSFIEGWKLLEPHSKESCSQMTIILQAFGIHSFDYSSQGRQRMLRILQEGLLSQKWPLNSLQSATVDLGTLYELLEKSADADQALLRAQKTKHRLFACYQKLDTQSTLSQIIRDCHLLLLSLTPKNLREFSRLLKSAWPSVLSSLREDPRLALIFKEALELILENALHDPEIERVQEAKRLIQLIFKLGIFPDSAKKGYQLKIIRAYRDIAENPRKLPLFLSFIDTEIDGQFRGDQNEKEIYFIIQAILSSRAALTADQKEMMKPLHILLKISDLLMKKDSRNIRLKINELLGEFHRLYPEGIKVNDRMISIEMLKPREIEGLGSDELEQILKLMIFVNSSFAEKLLQANPTFRIPGVVQCLMEQLFQKKYCDKIERWLTEFSSVKEVPLVALKSVLISLKSHLTPRGEGNQQEKKDHKKINGLLRSFFYFIDNPSSEITEFLKTKRSSFGSLMFELIKNLAREGCKDEEGEYLVVRLYRVFQERYLTPVQRFQSSIAIIQGIFLKHSIPPSKEFVEHFFSFSKDGIGKQEDIKKDETSYLEWGLRLLDLYNLADCKGGSEHFSLRITCFHRLVNPLNNVDENYLEKVIFEQCIKFLKEAVAKEEKNCSAESENLLGLLIESICFKPFFKELKKRDQAELIILVLTLDRTILNKKIRKLIFESVDPLVWNHFLKTLETSQEKGIFDSVLDVLESETEAKTKKIDLNSLPIDDYLRCYESLFSHLMRFISRSKDPKENKEIICKGEKIWQLGMKRELPPEKKQLLLLYRLLLQAEDPRVKDQENCNDLLLTSTCFKALKEFEAHYAVLSVLLKIDSQDTRITSQVFQGLFNKIKADGFKKDQQEKFLPLVVFFISHFVKVNSFDGILFCYQWAKRFSPENQEKVVSMIVGVAYPLFCKALKENYQEETFTQNVNRLFEEVCRLDLSSISQGVEEKCRKEKRLEPFVKLGIGDTLDQTSSYCSDFLALAKAFIVRENDTEMMKYYHFSCTQVITFLFSQKNGNTLSTIEPDFSNYMSLFSGKFIPLFLPMICPTLGKLSSWMNIEPYLELLIQRILLIQGMEEDRDDHGFLELSILSSLGALLQNGKGLLDTQNKMPIKLQDPLGQLILKGIKPLPHLMLTLDKYLKELLPYFNDEWNSRIKKTQDRLSETALKIVLEYNLDELDGKTILVSDADLSQFLYHFFVALPLFIKFAPARGRSIIIPYIKSLCKLWSEWKKHETPLLLKEANLLIKHPQFNKLFLMEEDLDSSPIREAATILKDLSKGIRTQTASKKEGSPKASQEMAMNAIFPLKDEEEEFSKLCSQKILDRFSDIESRKVKEEFLAGVEGPLTSRIDRFLVWEQRLVLIEMPIIEQYLTFGNNNTKAAPSSVSDIAFECGQRLIVAFMLLQKLSLYHKNKKGELSDTISETTILLIKYFVSYLGVYGNNIIKEMKP